MLNEVYYLLKSSTPTNATLARLIYGADTTQNRVNIRNLIHKIRHTHKVQIVANQYGQYLMTKPQYEYKDNQWNYAGKMGRPRKFI